MKILTFLLLIFVAVGCSDSSTTTTITETTADGPSGDLIGTVMLTDYLGRQITDRRGVTVQCEGTSYSAISDSAGNWVIHDLPTRTYVISFSKPEFYTWKDLSYSFVGGGPTRYKPPFTNYVTLGQPPEFTIDLDGIAMPSRVFSDSLKDFIYTEGSYYAHSSNAPSETSIGILLISSHSPTLSIDKKDSYDNSYYFFYYNKKSSESVLNATGSLNYNNILLKDFLPGETIYIRAYPVIGNSRIYDPYTDTYEVVGYGPNGSNILSAVRL